MEIRMENDFLKLFNEFNSHIVLGMSKDIQAFFEGRDDVKNYDFQADQSNEILISVKLKNFSKWAAKKIFFEFICFVGYEEINLYFCNETKVKIIYLYLTANQNLDGVKMEVVIK